MNGVELIDVDFSNAFLNGFHIFETYMVNTILSSACLKGADGDLVSAIQRVSSGQFNNVILNNVIFDNTVMPDGSTFTGRTPRV